MQLKMVGQGLELKSLISKFILTTIYWHNRHTNSNQNKEILVDILHTEQIKFTTITLE